MVSLKRTREFSRTKRARQEDVSLLGHFRSIVNVKCSIIHLLRFIFNNYYLSEAAPRTAGEGTCFHAMNYFSLPLFLPALTGGSDILEEFSSNGATNLTFIERFSIVGRIPTKISAALQWFI
ncbi:MAG TPA: hypothetical protein VL122_08855 [Nitrospirota bacterium]|nr:hypothetical protein [Nitrospirota bacterium]